MATSSSSDSNGRKRRNLLGRPIGLPALITLTLAASSPLAAQTGGDPPAAPAGAPIRNHNEHVPNKHAMSNFQVDLILVEADSPRLADRAASDLVGIASFASTEYRYDDGTPEAFTFVTNAHEQEYAQRFRLPRAGTVTSVTACFGRAQDDDNADVSFALTFYRDSGGQPGSPLAVYTATVSGLARGRGTCGLINSGDIISQQLDGGPVWLAVQWPNSSGKAFAEDRNGPGGTSNFWRHRSSAGDAWSSWNAETVATAYFLRMGVDHGDGTPPPTPGCTPTTTVLQFDGDYEVSMCYRTPDGQVGQAKSGIWASGESGLLWFFNRSNAEVLVKVLDGCSHNGYRWIFVAPVTTLEFNLLITAPDGTSWTHRNAQGMTASTRSDTQAFRCSQ